MRRRSIQCLRPQRPRTLGFQLFCRILSSWFYQHKSAALARPQGEQMKSTRVTIMTIATVVICGAFVSSARADCGLSARHKLTALGVSNATARTNPMLADASAQEDRDSDSIVGLWHVIFKDSGGQFFDEGYDQFHNDGTEVLNDIPNPAFGNVCLGVYERNDRGEPLTYKLHHVFWDFDSNGNLSGRGVW